MNSSARNRDFDRLQGDAIHIALSGYLPVPWSGIWKRRESGTLIVTNDRVAFFPNDRMRAVRSLRYPEIDSVEQNGLLGRRIVTFLTKDGPLDVHCRASRRLLSELVGFVNDRIGAVADKEQLKARHALTKLQPGAEHIAAARRLDEDLAAALLHLISENEPQEETSSPRAAMHRDAKSPAEAGEPVHLDTTREYEDALRQLFREAEEEANALEQAPESSSIGILARLTTDGEDARQDSRREDTLLQFLPAAEDQEADKSPGATQLTARHALTRLNTNESDSLHEDALLQLFPRAEALFADNGPASKVAAAGYLLTRLMVDLDSDGVDRNEDALLALFPQTEEVLAGQDPAAKLASARYALTRLRADGADYQHDDALLQLFQTAEEVFAGGGPAAKFGAARYALTRLRVDGSDDGDTQAQAVDQPAGSMVAHRAGRPPIQVEDQCDPLAPRSREGGREWNPFRRIPLRLQNALPGSGYDYPPRTALLLLLVLILIAGLLPLYLTADADMDSSRETAHQGPDMRQEAAMTAAVETERQSADFSGPPMDLSSNPTGSPASALGRSDPEPDRREFGAQRPTRVDRDKHQQVGTMIAEQRNAFGLSQAELALAVGQSTEFIASVENGSHYIHPIELLEISKTIGLDLHRVLEKLE